MGILPVDQPPADHHQGDGEKHLGVAPHHIGEQVDKVKVGVPDLRIHDQLGAVLHNRAEGQGHNAHQ